MAMILILLMALYKNIRWPTQLSVEHLERRNIATSQFVVITTNVTFFRQKPYAYHHIKIVNGVRRDNGKKQFSFDLVQKDGARIEEKWK